uniref:Uncharacterized protein n=1 Tax=Anguilla anguilla TaxID=7936 RepID=A0A0E9WPC0_ANGAN
MFLYFLIGKCLPLFKFNYQTAPLHPNPLCVPFNITVNLTAVCRDSTASSLNVMYVFYSCVFFSFNTFAFSAARLV